ncbi:RRN6 beta-propeller domain-containing protein [Madurella fahalii]|uniref:RRN6 beta-propeller domain-containing protein n=1 Tax=Madurella fahalii TaxID=1157608 RepID=A0ABQ0G6C3_9PEZI
MDDKQRVGQPADRNQARHARSDGIIGRLTYTPAQGDHGIGQLRRNRAKEETPHFRQVTPFTPWHTPAKDAGPQPSDMGPVQVARSQEYWLLEHLPEASIDSEDVESLLLEEIASAEAKRRPAPTDTGPLFSVGEISDLRDVEAAIKGYPVLAVPSGVAGNVLRFISLSPEEWAWTEADIKVRLHSPNLRLEGEWCQDGVPISLIKFAVDPRKHDPIRWLLVQNGSSTTLYEPELRAIPMPTAGNSVQASRRPVVSQIFANPLFTIPCERTGGTLQSDVCFFRYPEMDMPQLVIIDQCGYWSLWDITGLRSARPKRLVPVMRMCGNSVLGSIPKLPSNPVTVPHPHRILCLSLEQEISKASSRSASRTRSPSVHFHGSGEAGQVELRRPRQRLFLLSSAKSLHLFDLATRSLQPITHMVLPNDVHRILGVAPSRIDNSQAFILTSTSLVWVAARRGENNTVSLDVLVSCPHQKDINDPTLQLDVSPGAYINDQMACFVCVRSTKDTEMTVFWFIHPDPGTPVRYHRDLITLQIPSSFVGLDMLPVGRRIGTEEPSSAAGRAMRKARLRFFQLLTLGHDLDVHSALCVWSDEPGISVPLPDIRTSLDDSSKRRIKLLQTLTSAFTVPDEFDERAVFGKKGLWLLSLEDLRVGINPCTDFTLVAQRLSAMGGLAAGAVDGLTSSAEGNNFHFIGETIERETEDGYMPRRSLLDLIASNRPGDLLRLAREWDFQQEALHRRADGWTYVPEARRPLPDFGPDDLVERLRNMFPEPQPSKGKDAASGQSRKKVLQTMAAELFFSNIGVSALPESWTTTTATTAAGKNEVIETPFSSSLPFQSSPPVIPSPPKLTLAIPNPGKIAPAPSSSSSKGKGNEVAQTDSQETEEPEKVDVVALRLRKYAIIDTSPAFSSHGEPPLGLTPWELGTNPDDITWRPGQDLDAEDAINRRRKKIEARRKRAERLSQRIWGVSAGEESMAESSSQPRSQSLSQTGLGLGLGRSSLASSQPVPTILATSSQPSQRQPPWEFSSQQVGSPRPRVFVGSPLRREYRRESGLGVGVGSHSQETGSQGTPSQPKSQVLPGAYGGRLSPFKKSPLKKGKKLSDGRRLSGFR